MKSINLKWGLVISLVLLIFIWWRTRPADNLRLIFCDVGQGDGILVVKKSFQLIIDTGPDNKRMAECLGKHMPFWDKRIETVIITHKDSDHIGGLSTIKKLYKIDDKNIYISNLKWGDRLIYEGVEFEVLSPDMDWKDDNKNSIAGVLRYQNIQVMMLADIPQEVDQRLVWRQIITTPVDILKVSHHGSDGGTSMELLKIISPKDAIISVGKNNNFGHPGGGLLKRLSDLQINVRRTDQTGEVVYEF